MYLSIFIFFVNFTNNEYTDYVLTRINTADSDNGRVFMLLGPLEWIQESNFFSILFGHGIKSYSIIGSFYTLHSGDPVHVTSNNLYIDVFWESGILGLFFLLSFFSCVLYKIFSLNVSKSSVFVMLFVFFDIVFSSIFRGDYASFRFFIMIYLLYVLIENKSTGIQVMSRKYS